MRTIETPLATFPLTSPLFTDWHAQYVTLTMPGVVVGVPAVLHLDGVETPFQYTGRAMEGGAEIMLRLSFAAGQQRTLTLLPAAVCSTDLTSVALPIAEPVTIGPVKSTLTLELAVDAQGQVGGPLGTLGGFPLTSRVVTTRTLEAITLTRSARGPLYEEYALSYSYADHGRYQVRYRCYREDAWVEISEEFLLGMGARLEAAWNPEGAFNRIVSHQSFDFEHDGDPIIEELGISRPKDVLCRLQMPMLSEYVVPNNRGWFAFYGQEQPARGMLGVMGLYGDRWRTPVDNMLHFADPGDGMVTMHAALEEGERHWLLVLAPVQTTIPDDGYYLFNRLHAEFNALRLDAHLDLTGETIYDAACWQQPGVLGEGWEQTVARNVAALPPLQHAVEAGNELLAGLGVELAQLPVETARARMRDAMMARFERWVRQFQGFRSRQNDYSKNVIGFSRNLRSLMVEYEILRKTGFLSEGEIRKCSAYFSFAARRIIDEGRWPHSKTTLHPQHPDSTRGLYGYPGEHIPDKLYWTNCLPNFQSDPMCALVHLAALLPEHPDAGRWLRKGLDDLEGQLTAYCNETGAWEESINYALFTFSYFVVTFRILKQRTGIDYFQDARVRAYAGWLCRFVAMYDKRAEAPTWTPAGNAVVPTVAGHYLLAYADALPEGDPLRADCLAVYQFMEPYIKAGPYDVPFLAIMAPAVTGSYPLQALDSECMDDLGVLMRHQHTAPAQSQLFVKIGFWKDHYEGDESAFNWYAKGTPLAMEYGTYTADGGAWAAHNLVEIPDMDNLARGYLGDHFFSAPVDYTRCEMPVVLKLSWGKVRTFDEMAHPTPPLFFYIGDNNPLGPRSWKKRLLLWVKPDYLLTFDRVFGPVPHRYNLHSVSDAITRAGQHIHCHGRYDLDLHCFVQEPVDFRLETGELVPTPERYGEKDTNIHWQSFFRLYNDTGARYRAVLFAQEWERAVTMEAFGPYGVKVTTPEYTDYAFINDEMAYEARDGVCFGGRVGWIRRWQCGKIEAALPDGDYLGAFGLRFDGRGPWVYNEDGRETFRIPGTPRGVRVSGL